MPKNTLQDSVSSLPVTKRLLHYSHSGGAYQGCVSALPQHDGESPDWTCPVFAIEETHPFHVVEAALQACHDDTIDRIVDCLTKDSEQNLIELRSLLQYINEIKKYVAIPGAEGTVFVFDVWDYGFPNHEPRLRFILKKQSDDRWLIARAVKLMPFDCTIDLSGIRESDEATFEDAQSEDEIDVYPCEIKAGSGFDFFLSVLGHARNQDFQGLSRCLAPGNKHYATVCVLTLQSMKRVISMTETRSGAIGVRDDGSLQFQHCVLDVTATNWDLAIIDYQLELLWNVAQGQWQITGLNKEQDD